MCFDVLLFWPASEFGQPTMWNKIKRQKRETNEPVKIDKKIKVITSLALKHSLLIGMRKKLTIAFFQ